MVAKEITQKDLFYKRIPLLKANTCGLKNHTGRNHTGKITSYHKGGGHKRTFREVGFYNDTSLNGIVSSIEYDPNRSSYILSLYDYVKKKYFYRISPNLSSIGDIVKAGSNAEMHLGHTLSLITIPEGTLISCVSNSPHSRIKYSRAAGTYSLLTEKTKTHCRIKLPSGEFKSMSLKGFATIGAVSTKTSKRPFVKKAGRSRWLNRRPTVRGVAMNPIDHPHGGGEGKKSGKNFTPWGKHLPKKHHR